MSGSITSRTMMCGLKVLTWVIASAPVCAAATSNPW